jgi:DNA-binding MarR family transcriptional regulator
MVAQAVRDGLVERAFSTEDAQRSRLCATAEGITLLEAVHRRQQSIFERLTETRPKDDADRFAEYLQHLASEIGDDRGLS